MAGKPKTTLGYKQLKALALFKDGGKTQAEIALAADMSLSNLKSWIGGDTRVVGSLAVLFQKEWRKIDDERDENIKRLEKETNEKLMSLILRETETLSSQKKLTNPEKRLLSLYKNALSSSKQSVNIKNLSYSYTQGLTPEDLIHEFTKLKGIAESSFNRRKIDNGNDGTGKTLSDEKSLDSNLQGDQ